MWTWDETSETSEEWKTNSSWNQSTDRLKMGLWYRSEWIRNYYRYTLEKRSENSTNRKCENWIEQDLYLRRLDERQDDIPWRMNPCHLQDGECGGDWVAEDFDSMSIMSASRVRGHVCLHRWKNYTTRPTCDERDQESIRSTEDNIQHVSYLYER